MSETCNHDDCGHKAVVDWGICAHHFAERMNERTDEILNGDTDDI